MPPRRREREVGPTVTVVVATKNMAGPLPACLESVAGQTHARRELLVVDGASSDGTVDVLRRFAGAIDWWVSEPDAGNYDAWNKALGRARGDWVCFLGADDRFAAPDVLSRMAPHLQAAERARERVVYGRVALVRGDGYVIEELGAPWPAVRLAFRRRMCLPHPGLLHHRSLFADHGAFDASFRVAGDYEFLLRELPGRGARFVPDVRTVEMGHGGTCTRPENYGRIAREDLRALRMNGVARGPRVWARAAALTLASAAYRTLPSRWRAPALDLARTLRGRPPIGRVSRAIAGRA